MSRVIHVSVYPSSEAEMTMFLKPTASEVERAILVLQTCASARAQGVECWICDACEMHGVHGYRSAESMTAQAAYTKVERWNTLDSYARLRDTYLRAEALLRDGKP